VRSINFKAWIISCAVLCAMAFINLSPSQGGLITNAGSDFTYQWTEVFNPSTHGSTYGTPILEGNTLKFGENSSDPNAIPLNFASLSSGAVANSDAVDGKLVLTITAKAGKSLEHLNVYEQGGWSFGMNGTSLTSSKVSFYGATLAITGINGATPSTTLFPAPLKMNFYDPSPGAYTNKIFRKTIADDAGSWQGYLTTDVGALLSNPNDQVTQVSLIFNNALFTANEAVTSAYIDKKRIWIGANGSFTPPPKVPEPASLLMLGIAAVIGLGARRWGT
jgi:hypothetical protein